MQCYYFTGQKFGLENLRKKRLKVSTLNSLNDPFEMLCVQLGDKEVRRRLQDVKEEIAKNFGILCFSGNWTNPVQWGHYAENHSGLCLVFDIPDTSLRKIDYVPERISPENIDLESRDAAYTLMTTKFIHWEYEEEYRTIMWLNTMTVENGLYFRQFDDEIKLKKVIIGAKSKLSKQDVLKLVPRGTEVFHAKLHNTEFKITKDLSK